MHSEPELSQEMKQAFGDKQLGPTGRFPEGKLTENDQGELAFAVGIVNGKVVINFGTPVASIGMSPEQARQLALSLRQKANDVSADPLGHRGGLRRQTRRNHASRGH